MLGDMSFDTQVKLALYELTADTGAVPDAAGVTSRLKVAPEKIQAAFSRLASQRLLVLEPDDPSHIRMAPPFSGIPTRFVVQARGRAYYANCVWDSYGVAAALQSDATVAAFDGHTDEALTLEVRDGRAVETEAIAHFAVPAARWWDDIVFT